MCIPKNHHMQDDAKKRKPTWLMGKMGVGANIQKLQ